MNLNAEVLDEMKKNPCVFREERYGSYPDYKYTCSLTVSTLSDGLLNCSIECDPTTCPIWKTYIMQLITTKNFNIQKQEKNKND
jgi:hypothetical protein